MKTNLIWNIIALSLLSTITLHAQPKWMRLAEKTSNFYEIKAAFLKENEAALKTYYQNLRQKDEEPRNETFQAEHEAEEYQEIVHFMRAAEWIEPRVAETNGNMDALIEADFRARLALKKGVKQRAAANWSVVGPISTNTMVGNGRVNSIIVDPQSATTFYACTPAGQLWKSTDSGSTWNVISEDIPAAGVTNVAIDPTNSNIIYALTGDADRAIYHPSSRGLYKSTDGGATWTTTGLSYAISNGVVLTTVLVNPNNPSIVLVSGTNGIYRSTNGGTSFTQVNASSIRDLTFNPQNSNTVFAGAKSGAVFLRSYNAGATWVTITTGLPTSTTATRFAIDVSPADTNYVYLMATASNGNDMEGFYRSTDGGTSFTKMSSTPNIPNGQGWYNLCVEADPTTANTVYAGGLNVHKSTDGGATWTSIGIGHVDVHDLQFSGSQLLGASDGGVYRYNGTGTSWTNISNNLSIAQPYAIGLFPSNANRIISGHQDNGTNLTTNGTSWAAVSGGDGMIAFLDRSNSNYAYCTFQNGVLRRSTNGGSSFSTLKTITGGYWVTPYMQDPVNSNTIYAGGNNVEKSTDNGTTWTVISPANGQVRWIDVARTNNQIIYYITTSNVYKTTDGGTNWTDVTGTIPASSLLHVHIDVNNSNNIYVSRASTGTSQVYFSNNGGSTWTNISTGLPAVSANTVVTQLGVIGAAYCGTDLGVYYRDPSVSSSWQSYNTGLPAVPVRDLEIHYATGKIFAGTFGRSIWSSPLDQIIPVELTQFQGEPIPDGINLTWQTANEIDFSHFDIERSFDGKTWSNLKGKEAQGKASNYRVLDEKPQYGINYYRLKMVDKNNSSTYSKIVAVDWLKANTKVWAIYPNPVKDKIYLSGIEDIASSTEVQILDINGKLLLKSTVQQVRTGLPTVDLPNGSYFMDIKSLQTSERKSFIVNR
ncbi:MAG: T9SS type A sorting domain-containing protein [Saprospiraceae bacterium]|nr:T9SS type A sorting domain-containing protein [Saprospiraceae bacterium]